MSYKYCLCAELSMSSSLMLIAHYQVANATGSITINPKQLAAGLASRNKGESSARPLQDRSNTEQPMQSH